MAVSQKSCGACEVERPRLECGNNGYVPAQRPRQAQPLECAAASGALACRGAGSVGCLNTPGTETWWKRCRNLSPASESGVEPPHSKGLTPTSVPPALPAPDHIASNLRPSEGLRTGRCRGCWPDLHPAHALAGPDVRQDQWHPGRGLYEPIPKPFEERPAVPFGGEYTANRDSPPAVLG